MFVCVLYINLNGVQQTKHSPGSSWLLAKSTFLFPQQEMEVDL